MGDAEGATLPHNVFNCVHKAVHILEKLKRHSEIEELCTKALCIDPFDEEVLEVHLRLLLKQGKREIALKEYKKMEVMYYDVLGVSFPNSLRALYKQLHTSDLDGKVPLETTLKEWSESAATPGALYCDLNEFKTVYQITERSVARTGAAVYIIRIDVLHEPGPKSEKNSMKHLGVAILSNLRKGDLFTRVSPDQYMIMLRNLTYENCKVLINRIMCSLEDKHRLKIKEITIKPITPADMMSS
jgi:tetratricopeptide (TPR) repeat protein